MVSKNLRRLRRMKLNIELPDKETTSVRLSPTLVNFETIVDSGSNGEGRTTFARDPFETVPSLLPNGTFHEGPPLCQTLCKGYI